MELISKEVVRRIIDSGRTREQMLGMVESAVDSSTVSLAVFEQVKWERDVAIKQLEELGYGFGEKIRTDEDCISREAVNTLVDELARRISDERCCISRGRSTATIMQDILDLPSVKPKERTGEWQQDMDGTFLCSECGSGYKDQPTLMGKPMFEFCPICGCRMIKGADE